MSECDVEVVCEGKPVKRWTRRRRAPKGEPGGNVIELTEVRPATGG